MKWAGSVPDTPMASVVRSAGGSDGPGVGVAVGPASPDPDGDDRLGDTDTPVVQAASRNAAAISVGTE